jgi:hypothetical protein
VVEKVQYRSSIVIELATATGWLSWRKIDRTADRTLLHGNTTLSPTRSSSRPEPFGKCSVGNKARGESHRPILSTTLGNTIFHLPFHLPGHNHTVTALIRGSLVSTCSSSTFSHLMNYHSNYQHSFASRFLEQRRVFSFFPLL